MNSFLRSALSAILLSIHQLDAFPHDRVPAKGNAVLSSGGEVPSYDQFKAAVLSYPDTIPAPSNTLYEAYKKFVTPELASLAEQAQFLANIIWESGGLVHTKEIRCLEDINQCQEYAPYYGRGFIQLTWDYNYRDASKAIYGNDYYLQGNNYEKVAEPEDAWKTAVWFWKDRVRKAAGFDPAVKEGDLGVSVRAINGGLECVPGCGSKPNEKAIKRLDIYKKIIKEWKLDIANPSLKTCEVAA